MDRLAGWFDAGGGRFRRSGGLAGQGGSGCCQVGADSRGGRVKERVTQLVDAFTDSPADGRRTDVAALGDLVDAEAVEPGSDGRPLVAAEGVDRGVERAPVELA